MNFDVVEVMQEDRLLRSIIVQHVEDRLCRRLDAAESAALHATIDLMLQRSVIALVEEQRLQLRAAAGTELTFRSFLSHDLNNNLNNLSLLLSVHASNLERAGDFGEAVRSLALAQKSIDDTVGGMRHMLDHERLRRSGEVPTRSRVDLFDVATLVGMQFSPGATEKSVRIAVEVRPGTTVESDGELITLVLQKLVGNGVAFSDGGTVRVGCEDDGTQTAGPALWVSDAGPGMAGQTLGDMFQAFGRGEVHGENGAGLGLAIASEGAKLRGGTLTVESRLGVGSAFRFTLPQGTAGVVPDHRPNGYMNHDRTGWESEAREP